MENNGAGKLTRTNSMESEPKTLTKEQYDLARVRMPNPTELFLACMFIYSYNDDLCVLIPFISDLLFLHLQAAAAMHAFEQRNNEATVSPSTYHVRHHPRLIEKKDYSSQNNS